MRLRRRLRPLKTRPASLGCRVFQLSTFEGTARLDPHDHCTSEPRRFRSVARWLGKLDLLQYRNPQSAADGVNLSQPKAPFQQKLD